MHLQRTTRDAGSDTVVSVEGEIDHATAPELRDFLIAALDAGTSRVIVDLTTTDFLDSSGLGALVGANKHAQTRAAELVVVCPRPHLRRLFAISRLDAVLPIVDDLAAVDGDAS